MCVLFYACVVNDSISQVELSWVEPRKKGTNAQEITEKRFQIYAIDTASPTAQVIINQVQHFLDEKVVYVLSISLSYSGETE